VLADLRTRMQKKLREVNDLSFYPESFMVQNALKDGVAFGDSNHKEINRLADIADLALLPFEHAHKPLATALKAKPPMELYWACTTASVIGEKARPLVPLVKKLLNHENLMVRMRAAEFLGSIKAADPMPALLSVLNAAKTEQELMLTFNAVVYLRDYKGYKFDLAKLDLKFKGGEVVRRTSYLEGNPQRPQRKKPKK